MPFLILAASVAALSRASSDNERAILTLVAGFMINRVEAVQQEKR